MNVLITGGKDFNNFQLLTDKCDKLLKNYPRAKVMSIGQQGADELGRIYARVRSHNILFIGLDRDTYGSKANLIRFQQIIDTADCLIAFWDGINYDTKHVIETMKKLNKPVRVIKYRLNETAVACLI